MVGGSMPCITSGYRESHAREPNTNGVMQRSERRGATSLWISSGHGGDFIFSYRPRATQDIHARAQPRTCKREDVRAGVYWSVDMVVCALHATHISRKLLFLFLFSLLPLFTYLIQTLRLSVRLLPDDPATKNVHT